MFSDPVHIVRQCGLVPGMDIADIGAGSGHYALEAASQAGLTGRVYAIDMRPEPLSRLKNEAARNGLYNVEVILSDIEKEGTKLPDTSIHMAFACNVLSHAEYPAGIIAEIKRILYPQGRILLVDWDPAIMPLPYKINKQKVMDMFAGFEIEREISAGSQHYGLIFKKL